MNTIIKELRDDIYQTTHSQLPKDITAYYTWPNWYWGKDKYGNLYFKGQISGFAFNEWTLFRDVNLPLNEHDIHALYHFLQPEPLRSI